MILLADCEIKSLSSSEIIYHSTKTIFSYCSVKEGYKRLISEMLKSFLWFLTVQHLTYAYASLAKLNGPCNNAFRG